MGGGRRMPPKPPAWPGRARRTGSREESAAAGRLLDCFPISGRPIARWPDGPCGSSCPRWMRQTGEQHALQPDPSERSDQLARSSSATRDMGTDRCPIDVEAVEPKCNWPEFEISVQSRLIVSRPYSSPRPSGRSPIGPKTFIVFSIAFKMRLKINIKIKCRPHL